MAKAAQIALHGGRLLVSERSVRYSGFAHKTLGIPRLRQSMDDEAVRGYWTLAAEIYDQAPEADAIFLFATSGTSALGIYEGYQRLEKKCPEIHCLNSDVRDEGGMNRIVGAGHGGLLKSRRDNDVGRVVAATNGAFHTPTDIDNIVIDTSPEGKACVSEAIRYRKQFPNKKIVVICSGRQWPEPLDKPMMERCEEVFGELPGGL